MKVSLSYKQVPFVREHLVDYAGSAVAVRDLEMQHLFVGGETYDLF
jgi:hypothetical protein